MRTGIKNGKLHAVNIYSLKLLLLFIIPYNIYASLPDPKNEGKWVIVIDPGHGGRDPGALGSFSMEKNINLAIALKTGEYIRENLKNVTVVYTRNDDSTVDLIERPRIANQNNADLFISIHSNWAKNSGVAGSETYIMGVTKDDENLAVAMKENEVILLEDDYSTKYQGFDPKSSESYIIFTLMQNVFQKQSTDLALKIQTQFTERVERKNRGVKQAGFWVLFNTTMPSVLVETGFVTNAAEEKFLISKQGQDYMASAIYRACRDYMNEIDARSGISAVKANEPDLSSGDYKEGQVPENKLVFMVQVATSATGTEMKPENFNGLNEITELKANDRFKYATGKFDNYTEAVKHRKKIEAIYPDAFVIAVKDNKILPLQQALEQKRKK
ncbi:MAG: N-acetylmuramoyl-L-alanine amidase [Bacteroidales bacterium]|nr:N-acetylmuramoyl-L-alanine amidase [Bacteroidales bacterium]